MSKTSTIFNQLLQILPKQEFASFVMQHNGDKYVKYFSCWQQLIALLYAQTTGKDSLREIETGLMCQQKSWSYLGIEGISKSNLARANRDRDYQIYEFLFYALLKRCNELTPNHETEFNFQNDLYSLDSTTISLCLSLFPWAEFRKQKGAFKLHTLFNNRTQIPELIVYSDAKTNDMKAAEEMPIELKRDSILVADRAYIKYEWLYKWHQQSVFFVLRTKSNMNYVVTGQHQIATEKGVLKDEIMELILEKAEEAYPEKLRKITYYCEEQDKVYTFFTNNFELSAKTIADIYKCRWQIELFFKWIKQHLKIKTFLGTSKNAVMTQIWIAMIYYLLLSYIKFQTKFKKSILELSRMINETLLHKISLIHLLSLTSKTIHKIKPFQNPQLAFF
jgi:hypothetical protein